MEAERFADEMGWEGWALRLGAAEEVECRSHVYVLPIYLWRGQKARRGKLLRVVVLYLNFCSQTIKVQVFGNPRGRRETFMPAFRFRVWKDFALCNSFIVST